MITKRPTPDDPSLFSTNHNRTIETKLNIITTKLSNIDARLAKIDQALVMLRTATTTAQARQHRHNPRDQR